MKYRSEIDGLRAIAVLPVIFFHAGSDIFRGGFIGVDIFFVISGYLITTIIVSELAAGNFKLRKFYERRARRILPALFLIMFVSLPFAWALLTPKEMVSFSKSLVSTVFFSSNILFWRESGYFDTAAELKPLLHTWSLAVEEQYYIFFPLLLMALFAKRRKLIIPFLLAAFVLSLGAAQWAAYHKPTAAFFLLPTRGWELLIGAFCALYLSSNGPVKSKLFCELGGLLGLLLIAIGLFAFDSSTPIPSLFALVPTLGVALIIMCANSNSCAGRFLSFKPFVGIGLISYSAYLWHQPILVFLRHYDPDLPSYVFYLAASSSLILAFFSWALVERPFRNKERVNLKVLIIFSVLCSLLFSVIGIWGVYKKGNWWRYPEHVLVLNDMRSDWDEYVWAKKRKINGNSFEIDNSLKILIVGDSNSGDFINALGGVSFKRNVEISSLTIRSGCGNLYLPQESFSHNRTRTQESCVTDDQLFSDKGDTLLKAADIVVFASSWAPWEAPLVSESHQKIKDTYGDKFWYVGNKRTGFKYTYLYDLFTDSDKLKNIRAMPVEKVLNSNKSILEAVGNKFIDPFKLLCDDNGCPITNDDGEFMFYDGFHLTPLGAETFGKALQKAKVFGPLQN